VRQILALEIFFRNVDQIFKRKLWREISVPKKLQVQEFIGQEGPGMIDRCSIQCGKEKGQL